MLGVTLLCSALLYPPDGRQGRETREKGTICRLRGAPGWPCDDDGNLATYSDSARNDERLVNNKTSRLKEQMMHDLVDNKASDVRIPGTSVYRSTQIHLYREASP